MTDKEIKKLWGDDLYNVFAEHLDADGWLGSHWAEIIESEIPRFDRNLNDNPEYSETYSRMYMLDFEEHEDGKVRPEPNQFNF